jgi:hypothetical protein
MGQTAGFQETLRRMAMTDEGFAGDQAGRGLAIFIAEHLGCC